MGKKYHGGLKHLLQLSLFIVFVFYSTSLASEPLYNGETGNDYMGKYSMQNIVEQLGMEDYYSGDNLESLTHYMNAFLTAFNTYSGDLVIEQIVYAKWAGDPNDHNIYLYISNASFPGTNSDWPFLYVETSKIYSSMKFTWLDHYNYNGQTITYPTTTNNFDLRFYVNASQWGKGQSAIPYTVAEYDDTSITLSSACVFQNPYDVAGYTQNYGFTNGGYYFLKPWIQKAMAPTPTPAPSATPGGSGGDYAEALDNIEYTLLGTKDEVHNFRVDVNQKLDDIEEAIPTSGEIKQAQVEAEITYWGDSGDLSGDEQEGLLQAGINEIKDTISGDINRQETVQMIHDYEDRLYNLFMNPNDFRIFWNSASYNNVTLIPSGEINFSQMERDIPSIALIMTYVRTILNMILTINIIKSVWNLLMQFLGIHEATEEYDETGAETIGIGTAAISGSNTKMLGGG